MKKILSILILFLTPNLFAQSFSKPPQIFETTLETSTHEEVRSETALFALTDDGPSPEVLKELVKYENDVEIFATNSFEQDAKTLKEKLSGEGIQSEIFLFSDDLADKFDLQAQNQKFDFRLPAALPKLLKPSQREFTLGITMTAYKAAMSTSFFAMGLPPTLAATLVATQTFTSLLTNVEIKAYDKLFSSPIFGSKIRISRMNEIMRRELYTGMINELMKFISGPIGHAHAFNTSAGQGEILSSMVAAGLGQAIYGVTRHRVMAEKKAEFANQWLAFDVYFPASTLKFLDLAGFHMKTLFSIGPVEVNVSTLSVLATFLTATALVQMFPDQAIELARKQDSFLSQIMTKIRGAKSANSILTCDQLFIY